MITADISDIRTRIVPLTKVIEFVLSTPIEGRAGNTRILYSPDHFMRALERALNKASYKLELKN